MPSHYELALMCKEVYRAKGGHVLGWNCNTVFEKDGCSAAVYEHKSRNEMVIAFRGTDTVDLNNFLYNLATNFKLAMGAAPNTTDIAVEFVANIRNNRSPLIKFCEFIRSSSYNQLYLTGHSLGACIAEMVGLHFHSQGKKYKVITFESPGIPSQLKRDLKEPPFFLNFLSPPNFINTRHKHVGEIQCVPLKPYTPSLQSKALYYINHVQSCLIDDAIRLFLLIFIIEGLGKTLLNFSIFPTNRIASLWYSIKLHHPFSKQAELQTFDPMNSLIYTVPTLFLLKLYSIFMRTLARTIQQHPIEQFVQSMNYPEGKPKETHIMANWPNAQEFISAQFISGLTWFKPFSKSNHGLRTLFYPDALEAANIHSIPGYLQVSK